MEQGNEERKPFSRWHRLAIAVNRFLNDESEEDRRHKWRNRRSRLASRAYGGLLEDQVDHSSLLSKKKPSVFDYSKELFDWIKSRDAQANSDAVDNVILDALSREDESPRDYGVGIVGELLHYRQNDEVLPINVRQQLDEFEDFRPYFSYWISFVHIIVTIIICCSYSIGNIGVELSLKSQFVLTEKVTYEQIAFYEPSNFWIGPRPADVIHLGAVFAPCMRQDGLLLKAIKDTRKRENEESGCCVKNDRSFCMQTTKEECSPVLSTFHRWSHGGNTGPDGRSHGPVCGQDPRYCANPVSSAPNVWPDDLRKWPLCEEPTDESTEAHMNCRVTAKPCCIGIHGRCEMRSREYCDFVKGHFHPEATLCSQVTCMQDVCGMFSFAHQQSPDQIYRLWTSLFLHAGLIHLGISILIQWFFMRDMERLMGPWRLFILFFGAGILGNVYSALIIPHRAESGPSGGHFGLLAAHIVEVINAWSLLRNPLVALGKLLLVASLLFILGFLPWVDNYAHIFGFTGGLLLSFTIMPYLRSSSEEEATDWNRRIGRSACLLGYVVLLATGLSIFYLLPDFDCQVCKLWSCIPLTPSFCAQQNLNYKTTNASLFF